MASSESQATPTPKTYQGGCHCSLIRYTVTLSLPSPPEATKCNCSICLKTNRIELAVSDPDKNFKLLSPASMDSVPAYRFNAKKFRHCFCTTCGVHPFSFGSYEYEGQEVEMFCVNAATLDPDQGLDLREFKVRYWDGKTDGWEKGMRDEPYPGGCP